MNRVVIDANVFISGTIAPHGASAAILNAWRADSLEAVICPALLEEIAEKLRLPRIRDKYHVSEEDVIRLITRLSQVGFLVPGEVPIDPAPPDPDDTMLFSAAVEAAADFIITGDKLLLSFAWGGPGKVVSPRQFWQDEFRSEPRPHAPGPETNREPGNGPSPDQP